MVNGYHHHCSVTGGNCTSIGDPDSYLWYDELHPSEQTQRTVAKNFMDVINGNSSYATYYSS
jgi:phospholipase/lecithinase/hemolysin